MPRSRRRRDPRTPHIFFTLPLLLALAVAIAPGSAWARACGDDVDGHGRVVRCDCGDVLVSSVRLTPAHPLLGHACATDGLVVDIPVRVTAPVLDLAGAVIGGSGRGVGLDLRRGGRQGLRIVGPGEVRGFRTGMVARTGALVEASDVRSSDNLGDGFRLGGDGWALHRCEATRNARYGFVLRGTGHQLDGSRALDNGRDGFELGARGHQRPDDLPRRHRARRGDCPEGAACR